MCLRARYQTTRRKPTEITSSHQAYACLPCLTISFLQKPQKKMFLPTAALYPSGSTLTLVLPCGMACCVLPREVWVNKSVELFQASLLIFLWLPHTSSKVIWLNQPSDILSNDNVSLPYFLAGLCFPCWIVEILFYKGYKSFVRWMYFHFYFLFVACIFTDLQYLLMKSN